MLELLSVTNPTVPGYCVEIEKSDFYIRLPLEHVTNSV